MRHPDFSDAVGRGASEIRSFLIRRKSQPKAAPPPRAAPPSKANPMWGRVRVREEIKEENPMWPHPAGAWPHPKAPTEEPPHQGQRTAAIRLAEKKLIEPSQRRSVLTNSKCKKGCKKSWKEERKVSRNDKRR